MKRRIIVRKRSISAIFCCFFAIEIFFTRSAIPCKAEETVPSVTLTAEEQEYVDSVGTITVGQIRKRYPITNYDETTGELHRTVNIASDHQTTQF